MLSSSRELADRDVTMRVGRGEVVSAKAVGVARLNFRNKFLVLNNIFFIPAFRRNLISISMLHEILFSISFINLDRINRLVKDGPLRELNVGTLPICESCLEGKMTKRPFSTKGERSKEPLQLVHSEVCGPLSVQARGGYEYFVTFIDDYSRYGYVYLSETFGKFKEFMAEAESS